MNSLTKQTEFTNVATLKTRKKGKNTAGNNTMALYKYMTGWTIFQFTMENKPV